MKELTQFDKQCFATAIKVAGETYAEGNYPVGAVLSIGDEIIDVAGNEINKQKSFVSHAENNLIIKNGKLIHDAFEQGKTVSLYSTLEPCIQCLGASVTSHISRILFIEKDPNGGACDLKHDNIGLFYKEFWPEIRHCHFTDEVKQIMIKYFHGEIKKGNIQWPQKMLQLLKW
ncbi:MAG: nucleoside deaminase [Parcubacteria group bacterium]|jgi:tRNA(adenine34) deaminase